MNGLKKSANNRGSQWHSQSAHLAHKVTLWENVGSLVSKNQQKIGEANGMPSLPIVPTQLTLKGNVGSLDAPRTAKLFIFGPRG